MNPTTHLDRVFPLSDGAVERSPLRAPRLTLRPELAPVSTLSNSAFMRAWAVRRLSRAGARAALRVK